MPKYEEQQITCVSDLIDKLRDQADMETATWFRGHANREWKLEPSLGRSGYEDPFATSLRQYKKFVQNAIKHLSHLPSEEHDWIAHMQHYGLPTNLMDWTESPLVGLYFAVEDEALHDVDGAFYFLEAANFNDAAGHHSALNQRDVYAFGIDTEPSEYYVSKVSATNAQAKIPPMAVIGAKTSTRIQAQEGVFVAHHRDLQWMEESFKESNWGWRHIIPAESKSIILEELRLLMMDRYSIYPQIDNLATKIKEFVG